MYVEHGYNEDMQVLNGAVYRVAGIENLHLSVVLTSKQVYELFLLYRFFFHYSVRNGHIDNLYLCLLQERILVRRLVLVPRLFTRQLLKVTFTLFYHY